MWPSLSYVRVLNDDSSVQGRQDVVTTYPRYGFSIIPYRRTNDCREVHPDDLMVRAGVDLRCGEDQLLTSGPEAGEEGQSPTRRLPLDSATDLTQIFAAPSLPDLLFATSKPVYDMVSSAHVRATLRSRIRERPILLQVRDSELTTFALARSHRIS